METREVKIKVTHRHPEIGKGSLRKVGNELWKIGDNCQFDLTGDIVIFDKVEISDNVAIFTHRHHWNHSIANRGDIQKITKADLFIGYDVFIGYGAILIGVESIGSGAIIGAGAVVRVRKINAYEVWTGNPARCVGVRGKHPKEGDKKNGDRSK